MTETEQAPSPFLPGTSIRWAWDSTTLGAFKMCPRLYYYQYIAGWTTEGENIHLRFGQEYHAALESFDRLLASGSSRDDAIREVVRGIRERTTDWVVDTDIKPGKYKNPESLLQLVIDYIDHFANDAAQTLILADGKPAVELSFRFELDWGPKVGFNEGFQCSRQPYLLCGHLDRVVTFADDLFVMDRKTTTTTLSNYYFEQYSPNNQMTLYTLASQIILGAKIKGVIIDGAQILLTPPYSRFVRGTTFRTNDQLEEWMADLRVTLQAAEAYAIAEYWPMNDTACDKFGGCRFREICSKSPQVRERFLESHFVKQSEEERWNPLRNRG